MEEYRQFTREILIPEDTLQKRIAELGAEISRDYQGKNLVLICILRGGVMFLTDLMRKITIPHAIEFMAVSSYGVGQRETSGQIRITLDLNIEIFNRHVLIVEDIIDSGNTLHSVLQLLSTREPNSLYICTLLNKSERREIEVPVRYCGFEIPNKYVFGYGLDLDDYFRNLPFIGVVDPERYKEYLQNKPK